VQGDFRLQASQHKPATPLQGPVRLWIDFDLPLPRGASRKERMLMIDNKILPTGRPDIDNMAKLVLDAMNRMFWKDDAQVVLLHVTKSYSDAPGTHVIVQWWQQLEPGEE